MSIIRLLIFALVLSLTLSSNLYAVSKKDAVTSQDLDKISLDVIGLIDQKKGGFKYDLWQDSNHAFITGLIANIPDEISSETIADLKDRVLINKAAAPLNGQAENSLFTIRLKKLSLSGNSKSTEAIYNLLPQKYRDEEIYKTLTTSFFMNNIYKNGCEHVEKGLLKYKSEFWRKAKIFCQAHNGDFKKAELSLNLLKEDEIEFSEDFANNIKLLEKSDEDSKNQARHGFKNYLKNKALLIDIGKIEEPKINYSGNLFFNGKVALWANKKDSNLGDAFVYMDFLGAPSNRKEWENALIYDAKNNEKVSNSLFLHSIEHASNNNRIGETVLLSIILIGKNGLASLSPFEVARIISSLKNIGLEEDAKNILLEKIQ